MTLLPHLQKATMALNNVLYARESKASGHKELFEPKYTALVDSSMLHSITFMRSIGEIANGKMSMVRNSQLVLRIRSRQAVMSDMKHFDIQSFPEDHDLLKEFHTASRTKTAWSDISRTNQRASKLLNSRSQSLGRLGHASTLARTSNLPC